MGSRTDECAEDLVPTLFVHPLARNRVVHISSFDLSFCPALLMATTLIFPTRLQPAPAFLPSNPHMCTVDPSPHQELFCQRRRNVEFQRVGSRMLAATAHDDPDLPDIQPVEEGSGCGVGGGIRCFGMGWRPGLIVVWVGGRVVWRG